MGSTGKARSVTDGTKPSIAALRVILERSGIRLSSFQLEQLWLYHQLLRQYNPELNLTRIHNFANMVLKLYVDSMLPAQMVELPSPLLDLGTGPGAAGATVARRTIETIQPGPFPAVGSAHLGRAAVSRSGAARRASGDREFAGGGYCGRADRL